MKIQRLLPIAVIALAGLSLGSGCPTFPKLEDRIVELALGGTTTLEFQSASTVSTHYDISGDYDLSAGIDVNQLLKDAGIDASDVTDIKLTGVSYRVSVPNAGPLTITGGKVTIQRQNGSLVDLVNPPPSGFTRAVGATTPFITAPLTTAGVTVLNQLLSDILAAVKDGPGGPPIPNPLVSYHVVGDASALPYDFKWQLKIDITIVGKVKGIKVLT
jgi:hypothetical protein